MAKPVSLKEVAETLDALMDGMTLYVHQETGELYWISEDDVSLVEDEDEQEDLADWQAEMIPKIKEILDGNHWIALPDKRDIHEWQIMREFIDSVDDEEIR